MRNKNLGLNFWPTAVFSLLQYLIKLREINTFSFQYGFLNTTIIHPELIEDLLHLRQFQMLEINSKQEQGSGSSQAYVLVGGARQTAPRK